MRETWSAVSGAGGFIGSHLVEALVRRGDHVDALVQYSSRRDVGAMRYLPKEIFDEVHVHFGDVRDRDCVAGFVSDAEVVFHLAALIGIPYSYEAPRSYVETNVGGTLNVLDACREHGVGRVVCTSTSEVYGTALFTPITEDHPIQAQSPYSATKAAADHLCEAWHRAFDVPVAVVRPFNTYGARQSPRAVIPTIIGQLLSGSETVRLGSLSPTRDLLFVRDTVRAFLAAAESDRAVGRVTHVGTGTATSVGDLARILVDLLAPGTPIEEDPIRRRPEASEVMELVCDPANARVLLDWSAEVDLAEGLAEVCQFMANHRESWTTEYAR